MKKRIMAALLCLSLLTGTAAVYAEEETGTTAASGSEKVDNLGTEGNKQFDEINYTSDSIEINAVAMQESPSLEHEHVYQVEIVWGDMAFAYGATDEITKTWKPENHTYTDNADEREKKWYLVDEESALTTLQLDAEGTYASTILTGTKQNHVVLINHSDNTVVANVKIEKNADFTFADDSQIAPTITQDVETFAKQNTATEDSANAESVNVELGYDKDTDRDGVGDDGLYSTENKSIAMFKVDMTGEPADGELNEEAQILAHIVIKLTPKQEENAGGGVT